MLLMNASTAKYYSVLAVSDELHGKAKLVETSQQVNRTKAVS